MTCRIEREVGGTFSPAASSVKDRGYEFDGKDQQKQVIFAAQIALRRPPHTLCSSTTPASSWLECFRLELGNIINAPEAQRAVTDHALELCLLALHPFE